MRASACPWGMARPARHVSDERSIALEPTATDVAPFFDARDDYTERQRDIRRERATVARRERRRHLDRRDYTQGYIATPRGGS